LEIAGIAIMLIFTIAALCWLVLERRMEARFSLHDRPSRRSLARLSR